MQADHQSALNLIMINHTSGGGGEESRISQRGHQPQISWKLHENEANWTRGWLLVHFSGNGVSFFHRCRKQLKVTSLLTLWLLRFLRGFGESSSSSTISNHFIFQHFLKASPIVFSLGFDTQRSILWNNFNCSCL